MSKRGKHAIMVKIDWNKLQPDIDKSGLKLNELSVLIGAEKSYLSAVKCGKVSGMSKEFYKTLCEDVMCVPISKYMVDKLDTETKKEILNSTIDKSAKFKEALSNITKNKFIKPDPLVVNTSNYKYINSLSKETNELLKRGVFKDVNAAVAYIWFKLQNSFINSELPKIQIDTDPINNTIKVTYNS